MCPCDPNNNSLNPPIFPGISLPGFGSPFAPTPPVLPGFEFPEGFPEDLFDLINDHCAIFPSGIFKPNLDDLTNSILKAISDVMSQIAPFMSLYRFIQALLNMVLCVLEVLCAFPHPWRMARAIRRLFKRCLPPFLNLFPWLALLAMLIALLLLILALIQYIIERILAFIRDIIRNLTILGEGVTLQNEDATIAAAQKIAQLLCLIDNILAVLVAVAALLAIFEALAGIEGRTVCARGNTFGDDVGCCDESVCPDFIANSPDGLFGTQGELIYYTKILPDDGGVLPIIARDSLNPIRRERWQFYDAGSNQVYSFSQIVEPIIDNSVSPPVSNIFFPEGVIFNEASASKIPYYLNMNISDFDPITFHPSDVKGKRDFIIENVVVNKPYVGVYDFQNSLDSTINDTGTLPLSGGLVYEDDGNKTPYMVNGVQATLETFIHDDFSVSNSLPSFDDGYVLANIDYNLVINHEVLMDFGLITLGCIPEIALEAEVANIRAGSPGSITQRLGNIIPDVSGAQECAAAALAKFRQNVSPQSAAIFQQEMLDCMNALQQQTQQSLFKLVCEGVSIFESSVGLDQDVQFITRPIVATVTLRDAGGANIGFNLPEEVSVQIAAKLKGEVTLGSISSFVYDGYGTFQAEITSQEAGDGNLSVIFNGNVFSRVLNDDVDNQATIIEEVLTPYTFVGTGVISTTSGATEMEPLPRRDESDTSRSGAS